jgi:hypothetical protein
MTGIKPSQHTQSDPKQIDFLKQELRENDGQYFLGRLARFKEIDAWFRVPEGGLSLGADFESSIALSEARFAYVNGLWLSAILMSLTAIERHLAMRLGCAGKINIERLPMKKLIELALETGMVTISQATSIDELRDYRNAYAHFRKESRFLQTLNALQDHQQKLWEASGEDDSIEGVDVNMVLENEAKTAVMLVSAYFLIACRDGFSKPETEYPAGTQ